MRKSLLRTALSGSLANWVWGHPILAIGVSCHATALNYPETNPTAKQRADATNSLMNVLPCGACGSSSLEVIEQRPPEPFLDDRAGYCFFIYIFKSLVIAKLDKPNCTFEHVIISTYDRYRARRAKQQSLGCTEPAKGQCPQEIAE